MFLVGCAAVGLEGRPFTLDEAREAVNELVAGQPAASFKLAPYYSSMEERASVVGGYNCRNRPFGTDIDTLILRSSDNGFLTGLHANFGDCYGNSSGPIAGRYNSRYVYWYSTNGKPTYIYQLRLAYSAHHKDYVLERHQFFHRDIFGGASGDNWVSSDGTGSTYWLYENFLPSQTDPTVGYSERISDNDKRLAESQAGWAEVIGKIAAADRQAEDQERAQALAKLRREIAEMAPARPSPSQGLPLADLRSNAPISTTAQPATQQPSRLNNTQPANQSPSRVNSPTVSAPNGRGGRQQTANTNQATGQSASREQERERAREAEQERQRARAEAERAAKEAAQKRERLAAEAAKKTEKEAKERQERQAKADYLRAVKSRMQLRARTCPGPGYYIVGLRPRITPKAVECINVRYRAVCAGSAVGSEGVIRTFLGASTDCFMGDAAKIEPTPSCPVGDVRVEVLDVTGC